MVAEPDVSTQNKRLDGEFGLKFRSSEIKEIFSTAEGTIKSRSNLKSI